MWAGGGGGAGSQNPPSTLIVMYLGGGHSSSIDLHYRSVSRASTVVSARELASLHQTLIIVLGPALLTITKIAVAIHYLG